jgi:glycosyltransferase involved in cell wall biosynthesis
MRITIVQGAFLPVPPLLGGAVEKMWYLLGRRFAACGHDVVHVGRRFGSLAVNEEDGGVRYLRVGGYSTPGSLLVLKWRDLQYTRRVLRVLPPADIVVSNTFWLPILMTDRSRGALHVDVQRMPRGQLRWYGRAARLRANSAAVADAIRGQVPQWADRVRLIANPLTFEPGPVDMAAKERVVLYTGRLHPEKGVHLLVAAFKQLVDNGLHGWRLELAGPIDVARGGGGDAYGRQLAALGMPLDPPPNIEGSVPTQFSAGVGAAGADSRARSGPVVWHGMVADAGQLNALYQRATVFAYPSLAEQGETFGLSVLEAMAWGCVPVVSELACFRDFMRHDEHGWTFDHRAADPVASLATALGTAIGAADRRALMAARCLMVRDTHSLAQIADQFLADFQAVASETHD